VLAKRRRRWVTVVGAVGAVVVAIFSVSLFLTEGIGGDRNRGWSEGTAEGDPSEENLVIVSSTEVIQAFRQAGLEVGESYPVEQQPGWEESSVPKTYEEGTYFGIPSLGRDSSGEGRGGRVLVFGSEGDLAAVRDYWERRNYERGAGTHIYAEGNALLQISQHLPEAQAERYAAVLREAVSPGSDSFDGTYTVQAGERLEDIAQRFGTTVEALAEANNLEPDLIFAGQELRVPQR